MPLLRILLMMCVPCVAQAGDVRIKMEGWRLVHALKALEPRAAPAVGSMHLRKADARPRDGCVFVAGIRHCPPSHD